MKIIPIGQSGYIIRSGESEIVLDPYLSDSVLRAEGRARLLPIPIAPESINCDTIICTHDHLDHLDPDTVVKIRKEQLYITTAQGVQHLKALGRDNTVALSEGESIKIGAFELVAVFAEHSCEAFGVILKAEGRVLYFSGDTLFSEKLFSVAEYKPDVVFICINGRLGNMNAEQALEVARQLGAPLNIPNHYDMFESNSADPLTFVKHIAGGRILSFGEELVL